VRALTHPSVETFQNFLQRRERATWKRAYRWIFLATFGGLVIPIVLFRGQMFLVILIDSLESIPFSRTFVELTTVFFGIPAKVVVLFAIWSVLSRLVAAMLVGRGTYSRLAFALATVTAPVLFVSLVSLLSLIPCFKFLPFPLCLYLIVLSVLAVQAAEQFEWQRALAAVFFPTLSIIGVCFLLRWTPFGI
jgi:hypothetical protein